jgi:hypothetical protein
MKKILEQFIFETVIDAKDKFGKSLKKNDSQKAISTNVTSLDRYRDWATVDLPDNLVFVVLDARSTPAHTQLIKNSTGEIITDSNDFFDYFFSDEIENTGLSMEELYEENEIEANKSYRLELGDVEWEKIKKYQAVIEELYPIDVVFTYDL